MEVFWTKIMESMECTTLLLLFAHSKYPFPGFAYLYIPAADGAGPYLKVMELAAAKSLIQHKAVARTGIPAQWADLGCGSGVFTRALAELLPPDSLIYAVDRHTPDLPVHHEGTRIETIQRDFFMESLDLPPLDGLLMANSLHFIPRQAALLDKLRGLLKKQGIFLLVEYDTDIPAGRWNPFPVSFAALPRLFNPIGYTVIEQLQIRRSRFGHQKLYAALIRQ
jgi:ubiquinone/menaquinone biosynthesis C-methylase UbiE